MWLLTMLHWSFKPTQKRIKIAKMSVFEHVLEWLFWTYRQSGSPSQTSKVLTTPPEVDLELRSNFRNILGLLSFLWVRGKFFLNVSYLGYGWSLICINELMLVSMALFFSLKTLLVTNFLLILLILLFSVTSIHKRENIQQSDYGITFQICNLRTWTLIKLLIFKTTDSDLIKTLVKCYSLRQNSAANSLYKTVK